MSINNGMNGLNNLGNGLPNGISNVMSNGLSPLNGINGMNSLNMDANMNGQSSSTRKPRSKSPMKKAPKGSGLSQNSDP